MKLKVFYKKKGKNLLKFFFYRLYASRDVFGTILQFPLYVFFGKTSKKNQILNIFRNTNSNDAKLSKRSYFRCFLIFSLFSEKKYRFLIHFEKNRKFNFFDQDIDFFDFNLSFLLSGLKLYF